MSASLNPTAQPGGGTSDVQRLLSALPEAADLASLAALWAEAMLLRLAQSEGVRPHLVSVFADHAEGAAPLIGAHPVNRIAGTDLQAAVEDSRGHGGAIVRGALPGRAAQPGQVLTAVALPVRSGNRTVGWVGLEAEFRDLAAITETITALTLAAGWLAERFRAESVADAVKARQTTGAIMHSIIAVVDQAGFAQAAQAAVGELALRFGCDRVALGLVRRRRARVMAISHAAQFQRGLRDPRDLAAVMDEAIDQEAPLLWPADKATSGFVLRAHEEMERHQDDRVAIFTVPMVVQDKVVGAVVFERPVAQPFVAADLEMLEAVVTVLAPILLEKHANDRWLVQKAAEAAGVQAVRLFGPRHVRRKLVVTATAVLLAILLLGQAKRTVMAEAVVEGASQRIISASAEGFIAAVNAREGDKVKAGDILVLLDDRDLVLERMRLVTLKQQEQLALDGAIAARDRSQTAIREARIRQDDAQIALIDAQIDRTHLRAPFDGLVISGDLDRAVGSAVSKGEPLMTVAPLNEYRVMLSVDETEVSRTAARQSAQLRLTAMPERSLGLTLTSLVPVAVYDRGRTTFTVEARLIATDPDIRHGMQGVARIETGRASLWAIWVAPLFDRLALALWSWRFL